MSLFQICYGPEIGSILMSIQKHPGISKEELIIKYQYNSEGDISSLIEAAINFLVNLQFIEVENKNIWPLQNIEAQEINFLLRLKEISLEASNPNDPNFIFSSMYFDLFVKPNQLYIKDLYYEANLIYDKFPISQEKINAWKRMMEYFGLGYRVYGGFYALPHGNLMEQIINKIGKWEGPLQLLFENEVNKYIPCVYSGAVFNGILYSLINLSDDYHVRLSKKQDLPYLSFGEEKRWNWAKIGVEVS